MEAYRAEGTVGERALLLVGDPQREFVVNQYLALELLPQASVNKRPDEVAAYRDFLSDAAHEVLSAPSLSRDALTLANQYGLTAADALHAASAIQAGAVEFISTERDTEPFFRVAGLNAISIAAPAKPRSTWWHFKRWCKRRGRRAVAFFRKWRGIIGRGRI